MRTFNLRAEDIEEVPTGKPPGEFCLSEEAFSKVEELERRCGQLQRRIDSMLHREDDRR